MYSRRQVYGITISVAVVAGIAAFVIPVRFAAIDWAAVAALAALFYALFFVASVGILYSQLCELRLARNTELLSSLYDRLIRSRGKRQLIYKRKDRLVAVRDLQEWDSLRLDEAELADAVVDVSWDYHFAGLLIAKGMLDERHAFVQDIGEAFLRVYGIIAEIVQLERGRSGPTYRRYLDTLGEEARALFPRE